MEVSVLEAKRLGHRAVVRLSWLLLVASVAVLSLLYRAEVSADQAVAAANLSAGRSPSSAGQAPASVDGQRPGAEVLTRRAQAERAYAELSATGAPVNAGSRPPRLGSAPATPAPWSPSSTSSHQSPATARGRWSPRRLRRRSTQSRSVEGSTTY
jgi:hypothetical protein